MLNKTTLQRDAGIAKALIWLPVDDDPNGIFRWCRVAVLSGPNDHGQYHVRRLANGWEAMAIKIENLSDKNRRQIRNEYLPD